MTTPYLDELQARYTAIRDGLRALGMVSYPGDYSDVRAALRTVEAQIETEQAKIKHYTPTPPPTPEESGKCLLIGNYQAKHFECPDGWRDGVITNVITNEIVSTAGITR
jgi:hypothetical protein